MPKTAILYVFSWSLVLIMADRQFLAMAEDFSSIHVVSTFDNPVVCRSDRHAQPTPDIVVNFSRGSGPTLLEAKYIIRQNITDLRKDYVLINPVFRTEMQSSMIGKLQYCLTTANQNFFKASNPEESFQILVSQEAPAFEINLSSPRRVDSRNWGFDTDCATMVHEVFHILGMPDEYRELPRFPFRQVYRDGIMGDGYNSLFDDVIGYNEGLMIDCVRNLSPELQSMCFRELARARRGEVSFKTLFENVDYRLHFVGAYFLPGYLRSLPQAPWPNSYIFRTQNPNGAAPTQGHRTLVREPHFDAIVYPGCYQRNSDFFVDARRAYRRRHN